MEDLKRAFGGVEAKVDNLCADMKEVKEAQNLLLKSHWRRDGIVWVISAITATGVSLICAAIAGMK